MKQEENHYAFDSLSDALQAMGLPKPLHPLITLIDNFKYPVPASRSPHSHVLSIYKISYRTKLGGKLRYGQGYYDFDEGGLLFAAPNQIVGGNNTAKCSTGYTLLIHPDFFRNYPLAKKDQTVWVLFLFGQRSIAFIGEGEGYHHFHFYNHRGGGEQQNRRF